jgi:hypothetical protein
MNKRLLIAGIVILSVAFLGWLLYLSTRPLPGVKQEDFGREHVAVGTEVQYHSNPPTSGSHYEDWTRAGVYPEAKDDRNLVHSLEHGYIIMSYQCNPGFDNGSEVDEATDSAEASQSGELTTAAECDERKAKLEEIYNQKGKSKLIVIARSNLDTNFALTAWNYLDKFDEFDKSRIEKFINAHRDNGPEKTME